MRLSIFIVFLVYSFSGQSKCVDLDYLLVILSTFCISCLFKINDLNILDRACEIYSESNMSARWEVVIFIIIF